MLSLFGQQFVVTVSGGVSAFRDQEGISELIERADKAVYQAKRSGKNSLKTEND